MADCWNGDLMADALRALGLDYLVVCPGSSFRGLHESLVNHLGNRDPEMILALHEEHAVAMAHGYARVSGRPLAVIVHCNVGVMHASMAMYNAWCDRVPMLVLAGTGPLDSEKRRTPVDWLHSVADQGALVRNYTKWDDQPLSARAAVESLLRGHQMTCTAPKAPVYITLDQRLQEDESGVAIAIPPVSRFAPGRSSPPNSQAVEAAAALLAAAEFPVILAGRVSRDEADWSRRIELAETLGSVVFSDFKVAASFPTDHVLHGPDPSIVFTSADGVELLRRADVILSLDWWDQATLFKQAWPDGSVAAKVIRCSIDSYLHRGWTRDHLGLSPVDIDILAEPDLVVPPLLQALRNHEALQPRALKRIDERKRLGRRLVTRKRPLGDDPDAIGLWDIGTAIHHALANRSFSLMRAPLGWQASSLPISHPLDYLGADGAAGIGGATGMSVGAALALKGSGRIPIAVFGDGEFLMTPTALWTAASRNVPMLIVVANNRGYYIDEQHQEATSRLRSRPVETAGVAQRIESPEVDLSAIARAQGFTAPDPVRRLGDLKVAVQQALDAVAEGACYFLDVRISPDYKGFPH